MDALKASQDMNMPTKVVKHNSEIFIDFLLSAFNCSASKSNFLSILKLGNIAPGFKKGVTTLKDNYRPDSCILQNLFKIFGCRIF